jgi:hypothetical protein
MADFFDSGHLEDQGGNRKHSASIRDGSNWLAINKTGGIMQIIVKRWQKIYNLFLTTYIPS